MLLPLCVVLLLCRYTSCFCEEEHIVICDDITDIAHNDTTSWRHIQIGSSDFRSEPPNQVLKYNFFANVSRAKSVTIINRINTIVTPFFLVDNSRMQNLNLYGNDLVEIEDETFKNFPKLEEVYLEKNNIQHLGRAVFKNTSLEVVSLSRNRLRSISTCFLQSRIRYILLNHNEIRVLKRDAFPSNLEQLELNHNQLESIADNVFSNLKQLKELFLEHNRLTTIPSILNSKNIEFLHFSNNYIEEVHYPFNEHPELDFIDFSSNSIKNVTVDVFTSDNGPPLVLLLFNRLTKIVFPHPERKTDLVLYGNPMNCDCLFQVEQIILKHKHQRTCEVNFFDKGDVPVCIENGKCENDTYVGKSDIDRFLKVASVKEKDIRSYCSFRL